ncbi:nuclear hormone receptor family member nhr-14-like isoform X2 [Dysidea avara]|uniref:nuclear hormone receptor family member nhr-14-like isoform X2 n=1 Tax=Dysidea avara TaxID=196820 RepID=UPI00332248BC
MNNVAFNSIGAVRHMWELLAVSTSEQASNNSSIHPFWFHSAVQEERTPYPIKERKLSTRRTKSTGSVQHSPTIARNFGAMGTSIPFPFYSFGPMPINMVNTSFNNDAKDQAISTSVMLEILRKADEAENSMVLPSPLARSDRKLPDSKKRSLLSVISWAKKLPMFTQLPEDDQITLIRESWSEVNTLKFVHHIIKFPDSAFKSNELAHLYLTDDPVVVSSIQKLIKESTSTMQEIRLDETELSCLKLITLMNPIIQNLTASGQKETEHAQDAGLKLLESYVQKSKLRSSQRMTKLLLFHGQVKALTKDIMKIEEKQSYGSEGDVALLELVSQSI